MPLERWWSEGVDLFRPPLPVTLVALVLIFVVGVWAWLYVARQGEAGGVRRAVAMTLRLVALGAIAWLLAGPSVMESNEPVSRRVPLVVLADTSASMAETDADLPADADSFADAHADADADATDGPADAGAPSRWQALTRTWLAPDTLADLDAVAELHLFGFDESLRPLSRRGLADLEPTGKQTLLFDALRQAATDPVLIDRPGAMFLVLSDGHDTRQADDPLLVEELRRQGRPVFTVPVGETSRVADISVQAWADADFLFEDQSTAIHASLLQRGYDHATVRVELRHEGRLIDVREVAFAGQAARRISFDVTPPAPEVGPVAVHAYEVGAQLTPAPRRASSTASPTGSASATANATNAAPETVLENNAQQVFLQVSRERIRVALFEGEPYWETRFLGRVLHGDPQVALTAVYEFDAERQVTVQGEGAERLDVNALTPTVLNRFDVIVLGKRAERFFPGTDATMLLDYVQQRGGALVLARGQSFSLDDPAGAEALRVLEPVLPVAWGREQVAQLGLEVTPEGRQSPLLSFEPVAPTDAVVTELPGMIAATRVQREKAASVVLLRQAPRDGQTPAMAAIAQLNVGRGRVMAVLTDGLWRWALLPRRLERYQTVYHLFWARAIRWLATGGEFLPGQEVALTLDRLTPEPDEPVRITVATRYVVGERFAPQLTIVHPDGTAEPITPRRDDPTATVYHATFTPPTPGIYRIELRDTGGDEVIDPDTPLTSRLAVYDRSIERLDPSARREVLQALADRTGGACLDLADPAALLERVRQVDEARRADARPRYDFNRVPVFVLLAACLGLEWLLRRRGGLL